MGAGWAARAHEPTFSTPKNPMSLKFLNGLLTSGPGGRRMGSPSPQAHFQPPQNLKNLNVAKVSYWAADTTPRWAQDGQPKPTSPLSGHLKIEFAKDFSRAADIAPRWAQGGQPKPTSPLSAHLKIECR